MKKIFVYILVGFLSFSVVFSNYYKSVHAMDWVSGALSFAETLTWVLASLGITCTVSDYSTEVDKTRAEFWESYEQNFYNYVDEHEGNTSSDRFIEWKNKLCKGVLDKSSEYWDIFKSWASDLVSGGSSGGSSFPSSMTLNNTYNYICDYYGVSPKVDFSSSSYDNYTVYAFTAIYNNNSFPECRFIIADGTYLYNSNNYNIQNVSHTYFQTISAGNGISFSNVNGFNYAWRDNSLAYNVSGFPYINVGGAVSNTDFDSVTSNVNDLDVISSDGVDEENPEVTLPYPGVSDSDDTISSDIYQDIIDAINDGTITQEEGVERIHEILKVITYDTVTDKVVPPQKDPDTGEDKTKDEVIKENKENMGFTLAGLENVFPFCIPFDIYAFMTLLVAEPEAPEVDFPIQSINGEVEEIHIDLSPFDSVAVVVRYIFDFLFIIGLGILTRSLIGGGSSD